jgi:uncharacterized protein YbbC (DUF1343 family)
MDVGLDRLARSHGDAPAARLAARLQGARVGLLAHPASVDRELRHVARVLTALAIKPRVVFGPEHGYGGEAQDMVGVADAVDPESGAPIVSLYGETLADLVPTAEHLAKIDVLVVDLADVGSRYYTFVWTALLAARAAAKVGVHTVVLDRPNPLGRAVEGALVREGFHSFVGLESVPVRHGLTLGEIVAHFSARSGLEIGEGGAVSVLAARGFDGDMLAPAWDRPFVMTSPNMPTFEAALVYPGGCLIEGTNLSEGRGTTRPFELFGAPFVDGARLASDLATSGLPGFVARPLTFHPMFQKHAKTICGGVQIHVTDARAFRPYATYLAAMGYAARASKGGFKFRTEKYEYVDDIPAFDLLTGSAVARQAIEAGEDPLAIAEAGAKVDAEWEATSKEARALVTS